VTCSEIQFLGGGQGQDQERESVEGSLVAAGQEGLDDSPF